MDENVRLKMHDATISILEAKNESKTKEGGVQTDFCATFFQPSNHEFAWQPKANERTSSANLNSSGGTQSSGLGPSSQPISLCSSEAQRGESRISDEISVGAAPRQFHGNPLLESL